MADDRFEQGMQTRRQVLGDEYVDRVMANVNDFNRDFQRMVTEHAWNDIWNRPALSRKQHSLNNLCLLAALNRPNEFESHLRGALKNGCTVDEIKETLLQVAVYAGMPAGVEAFRIATRVLKEEGAIAG